METKPGYLTTEFWVTVLSNFAGVLDLLGAWNFVPHRWIVLGLAIINAAYLVSRGQAKQGVAYKPTP